MVCTSSELKKTPTLAHDACSKSKIPSKTISRCDPRKKLLLSTSTFFFFSLHCQTRTIDSLLTRFSKILNIPLSLTLSMFENLIFFQYHVWTFRLNYRRPVLLKGLTRCSFFLITSLNGSFLTWVSACIIAIR